MTKAQERQRAKTLYFSYGCSPIEWDLISTFQNHICFICQKPNKNGQRLATDHRHSDGLLRGLLCSNCNRALGKLEDPRWKWGIEHLKRVIIYLVNPPAIEALGREIFGYPGKVGTKKFRAYVRRRLKQVSPSKPYTEPPKAR